MENNLKSFRKSRSSNHFDIAWALEHLGSIYLNLGDYYQAKIVLEESLKIYATYFSDLLGPIWILSYLDSSISFPDKKIEALFNQIIASSPDHFHENYIYAAYPLQNLAKLYIKLGKYKIAKIILEQILVIYKNNYEKDHLQIAYILNELAYIHLLEGDIRTSESLLGEAFQIFQHHKHPKVYLCFKNMAELFFKKSVIAHAEGNVKLEKIFKNKATYFMKQSLKRGK